MILKNKDVNFWLSFIYTSVSFSFLRLSWNLRRQLSLLQGLLRSLTVLEETLNRKWANLHRLVIFRFFSSPAKDISADHSHICETFLKLTCSHNLDLQSKFYSITMSSIKQCKVTMATRAIKAVCLTEWLHAYSLFLPGVDLQVWIIWEQRKDESVKCKSPDITMRATESWYPSIRASAIICKL